MSEQCTARLKAEIDSCRALLMKAEGRLEDLIDCRPEDGCTRCDRNRALLVAIRKVLSKVSAPHPSGA